MLWALVSFNEALHDRILQACYPVLAFPRRGFSTYVIPPYQSSNAYGQIGSLLERFHDEAA
jgi:hypothetical protein